MLGTVLFSANRGFALRNSREQMIRHFLSLNWRVVLATADDVECRRLEKLGAHREHVLFYRRGVSPNRDARAYRAMGRLCRKWQPDLIQQFHAKPVVLGTIAARRTLGASVRIVNTLTGLGRARSVGRWSTTAAEIGFRASLSHGDATVFQNPDDQAFCLEKKWVAPNATRLIAGSGVDLNRFHVVDRAERPPAEPVVVMIARLLKSKGLAEFGAVAHRIRTRWPAARFLLAGEPDLDHPDSVAESWLRQLPDIEYLGHLPDVVPLLHTADIFLYPSVYREGVPRVVMEAAATGLPTVAFDVPGVREAVQNNTTGLLVALGDLDGLTSAVSQLIMDVSRRRSLGSAARTLADETFDSRSIQQRYLALYRSLGVPA